MPKFLTFILIFSLIFLSGCSATDIFDRFKDKKQVDQGTVTTAIDNTEIEDQNAVATKEQTKPKKKPVEEIYKQWEIEFPSDNYYGFEGYASSDCIGMANGQTYGGDLLSSLIVNKKMRAQMDLDIYTPEYIQSLEKKLAEFSQYRYSSDFYAFYVCHLDEGLDLAAGYFWPHGAKANKLLSYEERNLLVVNEEDVYEVYNVEIMHKTATGAEVYPCSAELINGRIKWSCFMGLALDEDDEYVIGSNYEYWTISVYGRVLQNWTDIADTEEIEALNQ